MLQYFKYKYFLELDSKNANIDLLPTTLKQTVVCKVCSCTSIQVQSCNYCLPVEGFIIKMCLYKERESERGGGGKQQETELLAAKSRLEGWVISFLM